MVCHDPASGAESASPVGVSVHGRRPQSVSRRRRRRNLVYIKRHVFLLILSSFCTQRLVSQPICLIQTLPLIPLVTPSRFQFLVTSVSLVPVLNTNLKTQHSVPSPRALPGPRRLQVPSFAVTLASACKRPWIWGTSALSSGSFSPRCCCIFTATPSPCTSTFRQSCALITW